MADKVSAAWLVLLLAAAVLLSPFAYFQTKRRTKRIRPAGISQWAAVVAGNLAALVLLSVLIYALIRIFCF